MNDPGETPPATHLWLFSSNSRALYAQDISNVLCLPAGSRYQFRYRRRWVGAAARAEWEAAQSPLVGRTALVTFSFQHQNHIHPPAFLPCRLAVVQNVEVTGSFLIVEFELGDYVALKADRSLNDAYPSIGELQQGFSRSVEQLLAEGFPSGDPNKSAVLGPPPVDDKIDSGIAENEKWERSVQHLSATGSFPDHLFFRVIRLAEVGSEAAIEMTAGAWTVSAGKSYALDLVHYQPDPPTARQFLEVVANDEVLEVSGSKRIVVSSGYDRLRVVFHVVYRDEPKDSTVILQRSDREAGSFAELKLRIEPPKSEQAFRVAAGTAAVSLAAGPGLLASLEDLGGSGAALACGAVVGGAFLTSLLANRSRIRVRSAKA